MPELNFTNPQGQTLKVNSPDGSTPSEGELDTMFSQAYGQSQDTQQADPLQAILEKRTQLLDNSQQTSSIDPMANLDGKALQVRAATGLTRTPEGKANAINKIAPELNAQVDEDGKVLVNGKYYDLSPETAGAFFYDLPGMIAEGATKNLPLLANLGVSMATGGASIPAQMVMQGAAMGGTEWAKELMAEGLAQEKPSGTDIAANTAIGAAGPLADVALLATKRGMQSVSKSLSNFIGPAKDVGPEILNATSGIKLGVGDKVFKKMDGGEDLSKIITPDNASANKPSEILNNTFFNGQTRTPEAFMSALKENISKGADQAKKMYEDIFGLTPQTIENLSSDQIRGIVNPILNNPNAPLIVGKNFAKKLENVGSLIEQEYGDTLNSEISKLGNSNSTVNIGASLQKMFQIGDVNSPKGVGMFDKTSLNHGYTGTAAKKVYGELLTKLEDKSVGIQSKESRQILEDLLSRNPKGVPSDVSNRLTQGGHFQTMPAKDAYRFIKEVKPLLDKTFNGESLSGAEKAPLAVFMKDIRNQLGELSPAMKAMNEKYGNYQGLREYFGSGKVGNMSEMMALTGKMKQAYDNPLIRSQLSGLDTLVGNKILTRTIDRLGASQEFKQFMDKSLDTKLSSFVSGIKGLADKTATHAEQNMVLAGYDSILPQNKKFLDPMWNHLIASEFMNKPISIFKAKYLGILALASAGMGHVGIAPALGVGMALSNPRNIAKGLTALQRMKIKSASKVSSNQSNNVVSKTAGRTALAGILQTASKAQQAKDRK